MCWVHLALKYRSFALTFTALGISGFAWTTELFEMESWLVQLQEAHPALIDYLVMKCMRP